MCCVFSLDPSADGCARRLPSPALPPPPSCVPSPTSPEAGLIYVQGLLLVLRTLLTDHISRLEGRAGRW